MSHKQNIKYLIAGSSGQLAKSFIARFERDVIPFAAPPESEFDITNPDAVAKVFSECNPDVILNCAAYNNVDAAETTPEPAYLINSSAVEILSETAKLHNTLLVHYGTDYVFDGTTSTPYTETSATNPLNIYGKSKLAGEQAALHNNNLVFRVSWVYGNGTQNFFHKMLQWSAGRSSLKVVDDQISVPTYTDDIVSATLTAISRNLHGLYHLTNSGYAPRNEVAKLFFDTLEREIEIIPVSSDEFPSPVKRPMFSAMSNHKLAKAADIEIPSWQDAVIRYCRTLQQSNHK